MGHTVLNTRESATVGFIFWLGAEIDILDLAGDSDRPINAIFHVWPHNFLRKTSLQSQHRIPG